MKRSDWLKFASGVVTRDFWSQTMTPGNPSFRWYLAKTVATVEQAVEGSGGERALIVGHSAGAYVYNSASFLGFSCFVIIRRCWR